MASPATKRPDETFDEALARAHRLFGEGKFADAEVICQMLLEDRPNHDGLTALLGRLCLRSGRGQQGVVWLRRSLASNDLQPALHMDLGLQYKAEGRWLKAMASLERAVGIEPRLLPAWVAMMDLAAGQGDWPRKLRCLQNVGIIFPEHRANARTNLFLYLCALVRERIATVPEVLDTILEEPAGFEDLMGISWGALRQPVHESGRPDAVLGVNTAIANRDMDCVDCLLLALVWRHLFDDGWYGTNPPLPAPFLPCQFRRIVADQSVPGGAGQILGVLRYDAGSSAAWNGILFHDYVLPALNEWSDTADPSAAILMEELTALAYSQQPHTEAQARYCFELIAPAMARISRRFSGHAEREIPTADSGPPVVAFVSNLDVNWCAPDRVICHLVSGLSSSDPEFIPLIVAFSGMTQYARDKFSSADTGVIDMDQVRKATFYHDSLPGRLDALSAEFERKRVTAAVYYHCTDGFSLVAGAARLAPVQVYHSMGYHYMVGDCWDGLFALGATGQKHKAFDGRLWQAIEMGYPDPYEGEAGADRVARGKELRRSLSASIVVGTICRAPKIDNDEFMDVLARILNVNPGVVFLWFGTEELESVRRRMQVRGISERCLFQGWVDSPTYAQAIDIHLDSFPYPTGLTMFDAMWAGCASVFMDSNESRDTGVLEHVAPLLRGEVGEAWQQEAARKMFTYEPTGESLLLVGVDADSCVAHLQRLIGDREFREAAGRANRQFMHAFKNDDALVTKSFAAALSETIEKCRRDVLSKGT